MWPALNLEGAPRRDYNEAPPPSCAGVCCTFQMSDVATSLDQFNAIFDGNPRFMDFAWEFEYLNIREEKWLYGEFCFF